MIFNNSVYLSIYQVTTHAIHLESDMELQLVDIGDYSYSHAVDKAAGFVICYKNLVPLHKLIDLVNISDFLNYMSV